jgi:pyruvate kinase
VNYLRKTIDFTFGKKNTRIIATVGPSLLIDNNIDKAIKAGVDIFRINFSHGNYSEYTSTINSIRKASDKHKKSIAILGDLSGPKIRIAGIDKPVNLNKGDIFRIYTGGGSYTQYDGKYGKLNIDQFYGKIKKDSTIIVGDGELFLKVVSVGDNYIDASASKNGVIGPGKGITIPNITPKLDVPNEKDKKDIKFAINSKIDYLAISFVKRSEDIDNVKAYMKKLNADIPIISKIEMKEAIENIDDIVKKSDAIMVARGDLGIEIPIKHLPIIQKKIITTSNNAGKPVITATQMLKSMVNYPMPTRAEVTDVVNAVLDGSDAVMLSEESAMGSYPIEAINMMYDLVNEGEKIINNDKFIVESTQYASDIENLISRMVVDTTKNIKVKAIIAPTSSGRTAQLISRFRLDIPIIAITRHDKTFKKLLLSWGVHPIKIDKEYINGIDEILDITALLAKHYRFKDGDNIIITGGYPLRGTPTNLLYIYKYSGKHT